MANVVRALELKTRGPKFNPCPNCHRDFFYQLFWTQAGPEGMFTNRTQVPCEVPSLPNPTTRKGWPHHRGLRPLLFLNSDVGSFSVVSSSAPLSYLITNWFAFGQFGLCLFSNVRFCLYFVGYNKNYWVTSNSVLPLYLMYGCHK